MKNKKGWLRIVEASFAIILILSIVLVLYSRTIENPQKSEAMYNLEKTILDEIASIPQLRNSILQGDAVNVGLFAKQRIPSGFNFSVKICELEEICSSNILNKEVFSSERVVSSTLQDYKPKKLKLFIWLER